MRSFPPGRPIAGPLWTQESGQLLPLFAVILTVLLASTGLVIDFGRALLAQRILQTATDAAAFAAAEAIPFAAVSGASANNDPIAKAISYSAVTGGLNVSPMLKNVAMVTGYPKLLCLTTLQTKGQACTTVLVGSAAGQQANAAQVREQATIPLYFAALVGKSSLAISAAATASIRGGSPRPSNVAVIIDTTLSMNIPDSNCSNLSAMQCALNGVQILLQNLDPCGSWQTACGAAVNGNVSGSFDRVSLFAFPNVSVGTAAIDTSCTQPIPMPTLFNGYGYQAPYGTYDMLPTPPWSGLPTALGYSFPIPGATYLGLNGNYWDPTYQITPFLSDYRTANSSATLNSNSQLVRAVGAVSGCNGIAPPNYTGDYGTYYAGAIYAAQSALVAEQAAFPGSENVIIILSDGDANAPPLAAYVGPWLDMLTLPPLFENYYLANPLGFYPSYFSECAQAVTAAKAATAAGTLVYSVAYGSASTGCGTDIFSAMSPCQTMAQMASAPQYFFSDYMQSGSNSNCVAGQPVTSLAGIFSAIAADLTQPRLIPDNTT